MVVVSRHATVSSPGANQHQRGPLNGAKSMCTRNVQGARILEPPAVAVRFGEVKLGKRKALWKNAPTR